MLARVLTRAEFGVYGITVFLMHFLVVFGDAGLAAGLVREPEEPDERDWQAVFTFQQLLVVVVAAAGLLAAPALSALAGLGGNASLLLPAAFVSLVLASFQTLPAARLERGLDFDRLALVEIAQALAFNGVAVACALGGLGASSMAAALVVRSATGAAVLTGLGRWPLAWRWDWQRVRSRLRFGLSFQAATFVNLLREAFVPLFVGAMLGQAAVGVVFFASMLALYPVVLVTMLSRLLLPMFARVQQQPAELARAAELSLFAVAALVVPLQTIVLALQLPLVHEVFGAQWTEALGLYRWLWIAALLESQVLVALALRNSLGHSQRTLHYVLATTALTWLLAAPLLLVVGPLGYGIAAVAMLAVKWRLVVETDAIARIRSTSVVAPVWAAAAGGAALALLTSTLWPPQDVAALAAHALAALAVDAALVIVLARERSLSALRWLRSQWQAAGIAQRRAGLAAPRPETHE